MYIQFFQFLWGYATFDLGKSMWTGGEITHEISLRFHLTLQVAIMATFVAVIIAIPFGIISAVKQNTWIDYLVRIVFDCWNCNAFLLAWYNNHFRIAYWNSRIFGGTMDASYPI